MASYDIKDVRQALSADDVYNLLDYFGGEPKWSGDVIISLTICHGGDSRKLWFYPETGLFHCYTHCGSFDVVELVKKVNHIGTSEAINFLVSFFQLDGQLSERIQTKKSADFDIFKRWQEIEDYEEPSREIIQLPEKDVHFLKNYPDATADMIDAPLSEKVIKHFGYKYDPIQHCWLLPHTDQDGRIIGVRQRTLVKSEEQFGKYRPWQWNGKEYNHPLGFNLYADSHFWNNIERQKTAIVVEAEKSVAEFSEYYGIEDNICCAMCGSSLSQYQFNLLLTHGVKTVIIGVDRDYGNYNIDRANFKAYIKKLYKFWREYNSRCNLFFLIDRHNLLGYKDSPLDRGPEKFEKIFNDMRMLEEKDFEEWV